MELPEEIKKIYRSITQKGFKAYLTGGCIRDKLLGKEPQDWDIVTNAPADLIKALSFRIIAISKEFFGTYKIGIESVSCDISILKGDTIEQDLLQRDFTINAVAFDIEQGVYIDPADGIKDINDNKVIRAVRSPEERFEEDPLRMLRGIRLSVELGFPIEDTTYRTMCKMAPFLEKSSCERIRDEFNKILVSDRVEEGILLLKNTGLLNYIIPELLEGDGVTQRGDHIYDVLEHNIKTAAYIKPYLNMRLAALLHDVGKPRSLKETEDIRSFPGHNKVSAVMAEDILKRLKYPNKTISEVISLIYYHLFIFKPTTPEKELRKLIAKLGDRGIMRLIELLDADRRAISPKIKLNYVNYMKEKVEEMLTNEGVINIKDLKINGNDIKDYLDIEDGPKIGHILQKIWDRVMEDPSLNRRDILLKMIEDYKYI
ncbi:MAG TPA: CCA tRNA nucleotidyltransferase [Thermoanaerobacterales bacterium]|nr:CCA tRNA nucleotidyltransferase [Thermoanaerobacterales bacterium]